MAEPRFESGQYGYRPHSFTLNYSVVGKKEKLKSKSLHVTAFPVIVLSGATRLGHEMKGDGKVLE